jgi:hypothetical protein
MASVRRSSPFIVQQAQQAVYVNGTLRRDIICEQILERYNLAPNSAAFSIPTRYAGDAATIRSLRDALVVVFAADPERVSDASVPAFVGYVFSIDSQEGQLSDQFQFTALSVMHLLDRVFVGQNLDRGIVPFLQRNPITNASNNITIGNILKLMFTPGFLDANWQRVIGLGSTAVIDELYSDLSLPDVVFSASNYREALSILLSFSPDIGVRELYAADGRTLLDFFRWGGSSEGAFTLVAPSKTVGAQEGAYMTGLNRKSDT